jgi:hypothetical protein
MKWFEISLKLAISKKENMAAKYAARVDYQKKDVDNQVKVECRENVALCFIKLPQEYLHRSNNSSVK